MRHKLVMWAGEYYEPRLVGGEVQIFRDDDGTRARPEVEKEIIRLFNMVKFFTFYVNKAIEIVEAAHKVAHNGKVSHLNTGEIITPKLNGGKS